MNVKEDEAVVKSVKDSLVGGEQIKTSLIVERTIAYTGTMHLPSVSLSLSTDKG